jgi:hypothetical protein
MRDWQDCTACWHNRHSAELFWETKCVQKYQLVS